MPYIQLQIATETFLAMFREGLQEQLGALLDEEPISSQYSLVIDDVSILPTTTIDDSQTENVLITWGPPEAQSDVPVPRRRYILVQPLVLHPLLLAGAGTATPTLQPLPGPNPGQSLTVAATLRVEVDAWVVADIASWSPPEAVPRLFLQPQGFAVDAVPAIPFLSPDDVKKLIETLQQRVNASLKATSQRIPVKMPLDGKVAFVNAGLAFDPQKSRMAILMQIPASLDRRLWIWERFHARQIDDLLAAGPLTHDWAQAADASITTMAMTLMIEAALKKKADELKATAVPGVTWSTPGGAPHLSVYVPIERNAPDPLAGVVDIDLYGEISFSALPSTSALQLQVALRAIVTGASFNIVLLATLGAAAGVALMAGLAFVLVGPWAGFALSSAIGACLGLLDTIKGPSLSLGDIEGFQCVEGEVETEALATKFTQTTTCSAAVVETFSLGGGRTVRLRLRAIRGVDTAVATGGAMMITAGSIDLPSPRTRAFDIEVGTSRWIEPRFPCGSSFITVLVMQQAGQIRVRGRCQLTVMPHHENSPVQVVSAKLRSADPLHVVEEIVVESLGIATTVSLYVRYDEAFQSAPYPFWILLRTNVGVRLVKLDPPPFLSEEERQRMAGGGVARSISDCYAKSARFFARYQGINVEWIPDPVPDLRQLELLWNVKVRGLAPGEGVEARGGGEGDEQAPLGRFHATARGEAAFVTALPPAGGQNISLQRLRGGSRGGASAGPGAHEARAAGAAEHKSDGAEELEVLASRLAAEHIEVEQTVLLRCAHLAAPAPVSQLTLDVLQGVPSLIAAGNDHLMVVDVANPSSPALRWSFSMKGLGGVAVIGDDPMGAALAVHGELGLVIVPWSDSWGARRARGGCLPCVPGGARSRLWIEEPVAKVRRDGALLHVRLESGVAAYSSHGRRLAMVIGDPCDDFEIVGRHIFVLAGGVVRVHPLDRARCLPCLAEIEAPDGVGLAVPGLALTGYLFVRSRRGGGALVDVGAPARPELVSTHDREPFWMRGVRWRTTIAAVDEQGGIDVYTAEASARG